MQYIYAIIHQMHKKILKTQWAVQQTQPETFQSSEKEIGTRDKPTAVCYGESAVTD